MKVIKHTTGKDAGKISVLRTISTMAPGETWSIKEGDAQLAYVHSCCSRFSRISHDRTFSVKRRGGGHYTVYPIFILSFIIVTTLPACSPKIIERIVVQHDTTTVHHRDTTYRRDSVYIREWMKGDTVYVDRFR